MKQKEFKKEEYQDDVLDLHRKILKGVQLGDIDFVDKLTGNERTEFLKYCSMVASSQWFEKVFSVLYWPHIVEAGSRSENYDIVTFNRATANGIGLTKEFFEKNHRLYNRETGQDKEEFDDRKSFEPLSSG